MALRQGHTLEEKNLQLRGRILGYSGQTNSGIISGDDNRYDFTGAEWREQTLPTRDLYVDFEVEAGRATSV